MNIKYSDIKYTKRINDILLTVLNARDGADYIYRITDKEQEYIDSLDLTIDTIVITIDDVKLYGSAYDNGAEVKKMLRKQIPINRVWLGHVNRKSLTPNGVYPKKLEVVYLSKKRKVPIAKKLFVAVVPYGYVPSSSLTTWVMTPPQYPHKVEAMYDSVRKVVDEEVWKE
jgi:hypothetical protein